MNDSISVTFSVDEIVQRVREAGEQFAAGPTAARAVADAARLTDFERGHVSALYSELGQVLVRHYSKFLAEHSPARAGELALCALEMHLASAKAIDAKEDEIAMRRARRTAEREGIVAVGDNVVEVVEFVEIELVVAEE